MKRVFHLKAVSGAHTTRVTIETVTDETYTRDESNAKARDVLDAVMTALAEWYRPSRITLR